MLKQLESIVNFDSFKEVFQTLEAKDPELAENIITAIKSSLGETHAKITAHNISQDEVKNALLREQITIQAQASTYLNISEQMASREQKLWKFAFFATELFFDTVFDKLDNYFYQKKEIMSKGIDTEVNWYCGLKDAAKKGGALINVIVKEANSFSKKHIGSKIVTNDTVLDDKTIVEKVLEEHLAPKLVGKELTALLEESFKVYKDAWEKEISSLVPDARSLSAFSLSQHASSTLKISFQLGAAEHTLLMGLSSAVAGSIGLAMGWHTITYALLNVFPPLAAFTIIATLLIGVITKDKAADARKRQVKDAVNQYHRFFLTQFDVVPLEELNNITLRKAINQTSEQIVKDTVKGWEKIFGNITTEDYRMLNCSFSRHLMLVIDALDGIDEKK